MREFEKDIDQCLKVLKEGGLILYPTDTIWGIGCDATNAIAVQKIYQLKKRAESKGMIILLADQRDLLQYVAALDLEVFNYLDTVTRPTTIVYDGAIHLADNLINADGSVGIRVVKDKFCRDLILRFKRPIVSTSANLSGVRSPRFYNEISDEIKNGVDYIVQYRQNDLTPREPSSVIKWKNGGQATVIRS
jgi:L-threonylcarbamoyladenylate synthase